MRDTKLVTRWYKYIILHHTATSCMSADKMRDSMIRSRMINKNSNTIPTHYIVWCEWDYLKVNDLSKNVWSTLNEEANENWIAIEIVWDFNNGYPMPSQYKQVKYLIDELQKKYPWIEVKKHWDFQAKNCPWKNFDMTKLWSWIVEFSLSRYYSPIKWQPKYYQSSYEKDVCMNCGCQKDSSWNVITLYDCKKPADWHELKQEEFAKVVACPPEYPLWTKFMLEWIGVVTCRDRGWAIKGRRLDLWCWYGLDKFNQCPTGKRLWYVLNLNN